MNALDPCVIQKLQALAPEDLEKVLQFVETLTLPEVPAAEGRRLRGLFAHHQVSLSDEDLAVARREACVNFPRDPSPPKTA